MTTVFSNREWDPSKPRSPENFNPFERDPNGNTCGPDGYYPGETKCRPWTSGPGNFAQMQAERGLMEQVANHPKTQLKGQPGNYQGFNKME